MFSARVKASLNGRYNNAFSSFLLCKRKEGLDLIQHNEKENKIKKKKKKNSFFAFSYLSCLSVFLPPYLES